MQADACLKFLKTRYYKTSRIQCGDQTLKKVADSCQFTSRKSFFSFLGKVNNRDPISSRVALNVLHIEQLKFVT